MACDRVEVGVLMQNRRVGADRDGTDEAIHELADRLSSAATLPIDGSRLVVVSGPCGKDRRSGSTGIGLS